MLQNEPLVAKIGVDTAENEPIFGWIQLVQLSRFNSSILSLAVIPEARLPLRIQVAGPPLKCATLPHFTTLELRTLVSFS